MLTKLHQLILTYGEEYKDKNGEILADPTFTAIIADLMFEYGITHDFQVEEFRQICIKAENRFYEIKNQGWPTPPRTYPNPKLLPPK